MTDTVSFGYADVAPDEKTRLVGDVFRRVGITAAAPADANATARAPPPSG